MREILPASSERPEGPVTATAYRYRLDDEHGRELASWHLHPEGRSRETRPHLHLQHGPLARAHLPTGHVALAAVLRVLLDALEVRPRRSNWRAVLDEIEEGRTR